MFLFVNLSLEYIHESLSVGLLMLAVGISYFYTISFNAANLYLAQSSQTTFPTLEIYMECLRKLHILWFIAVSRVNSDNNPGWFDGFWGNHLDLRISTEVKADTSLWLAAYVMICGATQLICCWAKIFYSGSVSAVTSCFFKSGTGLAGCRIQVDSYFVLSFFCSLFLNVISSFLLRLCWDFKIIKIIFQGHPLHPPYI